MFSVRLLWAGNSLSQSIVVLLPLRHGKRVVRSLLFEDDENHALEPPRNLLPLSTTSPLPHCIPLSSCCSASSTIILGRRELLTCLWKTCGCHDDFTTSRHKCTNCQLVNAWALSALSRQMLKFHTTTESQTGQTTVLLWIRGQNVHLLMDIQPKPLVAVLAPQEQQHNSEITAPNDNKVNDWSGPWTLAPHTTLSFHSAPDMTEKDDANGTSPNAAVLSFELVQIDPQTGLVLDLSSRQVSPCLNPVKDRDSATELSSALSNTFRQPRDCSTSVRKNDSGGANINTKQPLKDNEAEKESDKLDVPSLPAQNDSKSQEGSHDKALEACVESGVSQQPPMHVPPSKNPSDDYYHDQDYKDDEGDQEDQCDDGDNQETPLNDSAYELPFWQTQVQLPPPTTTIEDKINCSELVSKPDDPSCVATSASQEGVSDNHIPQNCSTTGSTEEEIQGSNHQDDVDSAGEALNSDSPTCTYPVASRERNLSECQPAQASDPIKHKQLNPGFRDEQNVLAEPTTNSIATTHGNLEQVEGNSLETGLTVPINQQCPPQQQHEPEHPRQPQPILYFVRRGGLSQKRIQLLGNNARSKGAVVLDLMPLHHVATNPNHNTAPTHLVLEPSTSVPALLAELQLPDQDALRAWLLQNEIQCVTTAWITKGESLEMPPTLASRWLKLAPPKTRVRSSDNQQNDTYQQLQSESRKRPRSDSRPVTLSCDDGQAPSSNNDKKVTPPKGHNAKLSELFLKLAKLHQSCPLLPEDAWKAYSFHVTAGRLRHLEFEINDDPAILAKVRQIRGFGESTLRMIQEYLDIGTFQRIDAFEADPDRIAMKRMMAIWGVGRVKASELVRQGYKDISQVRKGLESRKLDLDRNQRIGVECYEDILDEMDRSEVETIGSIVSKAAQEMVPGVEAMIMGSYRRGKPACGDVDVFLTHKDYFEQIPPTALGRIVDKLREWGHIAFHLTHLTGMKSSDDSGKRYWSNKPPEKDISTYFGVFHSPVVKGKRRRVDIKFFPYRERIFASLYFTGNGFFNRSMRLWASRKFKWLLNEKGLFTRDMRTRVLDADNERQVFDHLHLIYKEPHERDCFDAVQSMENSDNNPLDVSRADINRDDSEHPWIE